MSTAALPAPPGADNSNPQQIINTYKDMSSKCQQLAAKVGELTTEKEEHRLVIDTLSKLDGAKKAYRLVGGILVEHTIGEVLPVVQENFTGIQSLVEMVDEQLKKSDAERKAYKEEHGIMTQDEREAMMKAKQRA
jgi:prefoldin subunit 2